MENQKVPHLMSGPISHTHIIDKIYSDEFGKFVEIYPILRRDVERFEQFRQYLDFV
jgi:hypothetical protein